VEVIIIEEKKRQERKNTISKTRTIFILFSNIEGCKNGHKLFYDLNRLVEG
jgi:hypothetical protein